MLRQRELLSGGDWSSPLYPRSNRQPPCDTIIKKNWDRVIAVHLLIDMRLLLMWYRDMRCRESDRFVSEWEMHDHLLILHTAEYASPKLSYEWSLWSVVMVPRMTLMWAVSTHDFLTFEDFCGNAVAYGQIGLRLSDVHSDWLPRRIFCKAYNFLPWPMSARSLQGMILDNVGTVME